MATLNLYVDTSTGNLITSGTNAANISASSLPLFYGDTVALNIYLFQKNPAAGSKPGSFPFLPLLPAGLSLSLYITDGTISGTYGGGNPYTSCVAFTADATGTFFVGSLILNTANIAAGIGSGTGLSARMEIGYTQSAVPTTVFNQPVSIGVGIPSGAPVVPPGFTALSAQVALATFFPLQPVAGQALLLQSANGRTFALQIVDNADGTCSFQPSQIN